VDELEMRVSENREAVRDVVERVDRTRSEFQELDERLSTVESAVRSSLRSDRRRLSEVEEGLELVQEGRQLREEEILKELRSLREYQERTVLDRAKCVVQSIRASVF
jgi:predicted transcriptional regulator